MVMDMRSRETVHDRTQIPLVYIANRAELVDCGAVVVYREHQLRAVVGQLGAVAQEHGRAA